MKKLVPNLILLAIIAGFVGIFAGILLLTIPRASAQSQVSFDYDYEFQMSERFTLYLSNIREGELSSITTAKDFVYIVDTTTGARIFFDAFFGNAQGSDVTFSRDTSQSDGFHEFWNIKVDRNFSMGDVEISVLLPLQPGVQTLVDDQ